MAPLRYGWLGCLAFIYFSAASGAKINMDSSADICSNPSANGQPEPKDTYYHYTVSDHIGDRILRYFHFGGLLQAIAEKTQIPRAKLVQQPDSMYQVQMNTLGKATYTTHFVHVGEIDSRLRTANNSLYRSLQRHIDRTMNVDRTIWCGVGRKIDEYQSQNLDALAAINYTTNASDQNNWKAITQLQEGCHEVFAFYMKNNAILDDTKQIIEQNMKTRYCGQLDIFMYGFIGYESVMEGEFEF